MVTQILPFKYLLPLACFICAVKQTALWYQVILAICYILFYFKYLNCYAYSIFGALMFYCLEGHTSRRERELSQGDISMWGQGRLGRLWGLLCCSTGLQRTPFPTSLPATSHYTSQPTEDKTIQQPHGLGLNLRRLSHFIRICQGIEVFGREASRSATKNIQHLQKLWWAIWDLLYTFRLSAHSHHSTFGHMRGSSVRYLCDSITALLGSTFSNLSP